MDAPSRPLRKQVRLTVNGRLHRFSVEPRTTLLDVLRDRLKYTHTKEGCSVGECCSCAVIVDERMVNACLALAMDCDGAQVVTLEGMGATRGTQPVQESFIDRQAIQARAGAEAPAERREVLTFCHICAGHCAVRVTAVGDTIVDVAPDTESGLANEQCVVRKGRNSIPEIHGHRDRLLYPMKRAGRRGEGKWQRISWDEALDTVAGRLREIREALGPEYVAVGLGEPKGMEFAFGERFASAFGTPNVMTPGWMCGVPFALAQNYTFGRGAIPDEEHPAKLIVCWGINPNHTSGSLRRESFSAAMKAGAKLVAIDPRRTDMAALADLWIKPRPGADGALALGVLKVVIEERLYEREYVEQWTLGFDELQAHVASFSLEDVERVTWVPRMQVRRFARLLARHRPACIQWGNALDQGGNAFQLHRAISILAAITGNLGVPGGLVWVDARGNSVRPAKFYIPSRERRNAERAIGVEQYPLAVRSAVVPTRLFIKAMLEGKPYRPRAAIFVLTNPLVSYPNSRDTYEALMKLDFIAVSELFMTPTANIADIVLPAATGMEHDELGYWPGWYGQVRAHPKVVNAPGECWPDTKILNELAKRLGLADDFWRDDEEAFDAWIEPSGLSFEELKKRRTLMPELVRGRGPHPTPSGKVEIVSARLAEVNITTMPRWEEVSALRELPEEYPLLMTNAKEEIFMNTGYKQIASLRAMKPEPIVQMHPTTAAKIRLVEGDEVVIETRQGKVTQRLALDDSLDPRVVNASFGWWFPEDPQGNFGWERANINLLTRDEGPYDPGAGGMQLRGVPCRVYKA
ncbi:MAG: molybdopterin-dependent oxidoreductase [Burkholderiales bacterium]|nr:molybdopterin-dependent oxidoreductase [Burkholderiales bacterium]